MSWRWVEDFQGIPFLRRGRTRAGCDCWGLVRLVLAERAGVQVPSFAEVATNDGKGINDEIQRQTSGGGWCQVRLEQMQPFDCVLMLGRMRINGAVHPAETHIGIMVAPGRLMHIEKGIDAVVVELTNPTVRDRVTRAFRYEVLR